MDIGTTRQVRQAHPSFIIRLAFNWLQDMYIGRQCHGAVCTKLRLPTFICLVFYSCEAAPALSYTNLPFLVGCNETSSFCRVDRVCGRLPALCSCLVSTPFVVGLERLFLLVFTCLIWRLGVTRVDPPTPDKPCPLMPVGPSRRLLANHAGPSAL